MNPILDMQSRRGADARNASCPPTLAPPLVCRVTPPLKVFHPGEFDANLAFIRKSQSYERATSAECDLIVYPELLQARKDTQKKLREIAARCQFGRLKTLVFVLNDYEERYRDCGNLILARTSARASQLRPNEMVLPYVWESPARAFAPSPTSAVPRVGFCGLVSRHRKAILKTFQNSPDVECDFILRDKFWGGAPHDPGLVAEYYSNLERNQYVLCNRGAGNFSIRFYQTLACGRIPVLVNTDLPLPFAERIPWRDLIVLEDRERDCLDRVLAIHRSGDYLKRQVLCRETFHRFFSMQHYFDRLAEELREKYLPARAA